MDEGFDSRIVTQSQVHAQFNPYEEDIETGIAENPRDEHSTEQNPLTISQLKLPMFHGQNKWHLKLLPKQQVLPLTLLSFVS